MAIDDGLEEERRIMDERCRDAEHGVPFDDPLSALCKHPALSVPVGALVRDVIAVLQSTNTGAVVVVDDAGRLVGIVTERDLLRKVLGRSASDDVPVTEVMTADPETLQREDAIGFVMNKMHVGGFRHVPIVDDDARPLHVISIRDVLGFVLDQFPARVLNLPSQPLRGETERYGG